jgi:hypothetical protein
MRQVTDAVVDEFNKLLENVCARHHNVHYIDQRGLLRPASPDATGPDNDWMDEIHPVKAAFEHLAANRWNVKLAGLLGWKPLGDGDLLAADKPLNPSTSLA